MNSNKLRVHPFVEYDFIDAKDWYNSKGENLGEEFLNEVQKAISKISQNPKQFPIINQNVRKAIIKKFPFTIFFIFEINTIDIYAVFHNSRNPLNWKSRLKS